MFSAIEKGGAYLNGRPISVSTAKSMSEAAVATEAGYDRSDDGVALQLNRMDQMLRVGKAQSFRMHGCCTHNLTSLACGRIDAYYEGKDVTSGPKPWDFAAAALIVSEAGGYIGNMEGGELDIFSGRGAAAATAELFGEVIELLSNAEALSN